LPIIQLPFTGPAYKGRSANINAQECINLIHNVDRSGGKAILSLMNRPCLSLFATIGAQPIRGQIQVNGIVYTVSGNKLYSVLNNGTVTELGTITTSILSVGMAWNGTEIIIVDGTDGYLYNPTTATFSTIAAAGFGDGNDVTFMDSYFIVNNPDSGVAQSSGIRDGSSWSALDKATAEGDPDNLIAPVAIYDDLWLMGESTSEIWYNAANPYGFPFARRARLNMGIAARWGKTIADNTLYWLAQNKEGVFGIVRATGGVPEKISTLAIDFAINSYQFISDCVAWSFTLEGHTFVGFTFFGGNATWVYDTSTGLWSEWKSGTNKFSCAYPVLLNYQHIMGDLTTGKLYTINFGQYSDAGATVTKTRATQHISQNGQRISFNSVWIEFEAGVGLVTGQGSDPQAMLQWSDDGGHTWSNEYWRSIGKIGEYKYRAKWNRLGHSRDRVFRVTVSDSVKCVILNAYADVDASDS